ncbi:MAG: hypothetical protein ACHQ4H_12875 [Ktedonobacterales bacterium]
MHPDGDEPVSASREPESAGSGAGRRPPIGRVSTVVAVVAVGLVVALFALLVLRQSTAASFPQGAAPPVDWQTYRDPTGLFSVKLPRSWQVTIETGTSSFGDRTGSATEQDEMISFTDPALGSASASVYVYAAPIHTAFEQHWYCQARQDYNATFDGIAAHAEGDVLWLFETRNAHFQLSYVIPGVKGPPHSSPIMRGPVVTETPLPQAEIATDESIVNAMLVSFQLTSTHSLSC